MINLATRSLPSWCQYAVVTLLVLASGHPAFSWGSHEPVLVVSAVVMTMLLLWRRVATVTPGLVLVAGGFTAILLVQSVLLAFTPVVTILGFLIRLYVAYLCMRLVDSFPRRYVNVLCALVVLSLFWHAVDSVTAAVGISLRDVLPKFGRIWDPTKPYHIIVHNLNHREGPLPYRNSGVFWEPTAFGGYLLLAIVFLGLTRRTYLTGYRWRLALLLVGMLSTMSTTGFIALPVALLTHLPPQAFRARAGRSLVPYAVVALLVLGTAGLWQFSWMGAKITRQYKQATLQESGSQINRFGTLMADLEYIKARPILGWGLHAKTRYALDPGTQIAKATGNGLSDFTAKFGLVGMGLYVLCTWLGFLHVSGRQPLKAFLSLLVVMLVLAGETFLNHPMFLSLVFLCPAPLVGRLAWPARGGAIRSAIT